MDCNEVISKLVEGLLFTVDADNILSFASATVVISERFKVRLSIRPKEWHFNLILAGSYQENRVLNEKYSVSGGSTFTEASLVGVRKKIKLALDKVLEDKDLIIAELVDRDLMKKREIEIKKKVEEIGRTTNKFHFNNVQARARDNSVYTELRLTIPMDKLEEFVAFLNKNLV
jgi:hypothetical protein